MPARADSTNAFDLKLLKALINLRIMKNHDDQLTSYHKRKLCKNYNTAGTITLSYSYLVKILPKKKEIRNNLGTDGLNQLCSILRPGYQWSDYTNDISKFRPSEIITNKRYYLLSLAHKEKIDSTIDGIFKRYKTFEEFEKEVIDKIEMHFAEKKNKTGVDLNQNSFRIANQDIVAFTTRIYIELSTRKAAIPIDENEDVIEEIYDSWYKLFCIIREEMKSLPVIYFKDQSHASPAIELAQEILNEILRPHLTKYQAKYRSWLEKEKQNSKNKNITPQALQKKYPDYQSMIKSLKQTNKVLIDSANKIYGLI